MTLLASITDDDKNPGSLEGKIDNDLDHIVKHIKTDLGDMNEKDVKSVCFCIIRLEPQIISAVLGLSISNVYTKKSRLKESLRTIDSPYKEQNLLMLK